MCTGPVVELHGHVRILLQVTQFCIRKHGHVRILLHVTQFCIRKQSRYRPYGLWPHVREFVWAQEDAVQWLLSCGLCCFAVLADIWQVVLGEFPDRCTQCTHSVTTSPLFPCINLHALVSER